MGVLWPFLFLIKFGKKGRDNVLEKVKNLRVEEQEDNTIFGSSEYAIVKITSQSYCSACHKEFKDMELCFWTPNDNTIICQSDKCTSMHAELEPRLFVRP